MPLNIQRLNFDPVTGDNPSEAFMKLDQDIAELADAIGSAGEGDGSLSERIEAVEGVVDGLGNSSTKDVGAAAGTVAAGDDSRFSLLTQNWTFRNQLLNADFFWNQRLFGGGVQTTGFNYDMWFDDGSHGSLTRSSTTMLVTLTGGATSQCIIGGGDRNAGLPCVVSAEAPSAPITVTITPTTGTGVTVSIPAGAGRQFVAFTAAGNWSGNLKVKFSSTPTVTFKRVQFENGTLPTPYEDRTRPLERFLLQAYLRSSIGYGTPLANSQIGKVIPAVAYGTNSIIGSFDFDQPMAAVPAITFFSSTAASSNTAGQWQVLVGGFVNTSGLAVYRANEKGFAFTAAVASGLAVFSSVYMQGNYMAAVEVTL